jgi:hypothetical protein
MTAILCHGREIVMKRRHGKSSITNPFLVMRYFVVFAAALNFVMLKIRDVNHS